MKVKSILVLGVGNILLKDEGVGVKVIEKLQSQYRFSPNVELMDGGTLGLRLLDPISRCDHVIVVDAVQNGHPPGTLHRLPTEELQKRTTFKNSLHQLDLVETLAYAEVLGHRPSALIIGIEPADITPWGTELTEVVRGKFDELCSRVLDEIEAAGGVFTPKSAMVEAQGTD